MKRLFNSFFVNSLFVGLGLLAVSCTEDIYMDAPTGKKVPVVEASITNEYKCHEAILSYSSEMYDTLGSEMITGAEVFLVESHSYQGPGDTIYFHELTDKPGHYLTDSLAGKKNHWYHFQVKAEQNSLYDTKALTMEADTKMSNNATGIDSVGLLPLRNEEGLPFVDENAAVCVCPYFQTLSDNSIIYNVQLYLNGSHFKNRPSKLFNLFSMQGYAGYYFNGPEMLEDNIEIPVGIMNKVYMHEGDVVKVKLYSISKDYMYFLVGQKLAVGINPVMGAFSAMFSNIFSNCGAIGWFNATSVIEGEGIYHEAMFDE